MKLVKLCVLSEVCNHVSEINFVGITFVGSMIESVTVTRLSSSTKLFMNCIFAVSVCMYTYVYIYTIFVKVFIPQLFIIYVCLINEICMINCVLIFSFLYFSTFQLFFVVQYRNECHICQGI